MGKQGDLENSELHSKSKGFKSVSATPSKPLESGIALFFYKDKHGTPNVLFKWGEEADTLLRGNGFSKALCLRSQDKGYAKSPKPHHHKEG